MKINQPELSMVYLCLHKDSNQIYMWINCKSKPVSDRRGWWDSPGYGATVIKVNRGALPTAIVRAIDANPTKLIPFELHLI